MKISRKRKSKIAKGFADYQLVPDDIDTLNFDEMDHFTPWSFKERIQNKLRAYFSGLWFRAIVRNLKYSVYELGSGNYGTFVEEERYKPRAEYLTNNFWMLTQFGIYVVEYTISNGIAYSHYSLNYGVSYNIFMESQLTDKHETNLEILVNLFKETEEHLFWTISQRRAPYFSN